MISAINGTRAPTRADDVRGLDRSHRGGRSAAGAAAPARYRTQSRADAVGVGRARDVRARRALDRQAQPDGERQRPDLRRRLGQRRLPDARSEHAHGDRGADPGARPDASAGQAAGRCRGRRRTGAASSYWYDPAITNHAAMDSKGRVWMSSRFRRPENQPAFCADHPSAALAPQPTSFRQVQYFDPRTKQFHQVNICFDTHHVQFAQRRGRNALRQRRLQRRASAGSTRASSTRPATRAPRRAGACRITI